MAISFAFFAFEIIRHSFCHSEVRRDFAGLFERGFEVFDDFPSGNALVEEEKVTRQ